MKKLTESDQSTRPSSRKDDGPRKRRSRRLKLERVRKVVLAVAILVVGAVVFSFSRSGSQPLSNMMTAADLTDIRRVALVFLAAGLFLLWSQMVDRAGS